MPTGHALPYASTPGRGMIPLHPTFFDNLSLLFA